MLTLQIIFTLLPAFLIIYIMYSLFIKPYQALSFYKKQGCKMRFFPLLGTFKRCLESFDSQGDFYGYFKTEVQNNPQIRVLGGNLAEKTQLFLVDPELIKEFFRTQDNYYKAPQVIDLLKFLMGNSLVTAEESVWKRHRKIIGTAFHFEILREMVPDIIKIADEIFTELKEKDLSEVAVTQVFETITGDIVGRLFFGAEFSKYRIRGMPVTAFLSSLVARVGSELSSPSYLMLGTRGIQWRLLKKYKVMMDDIKELQEFAKTIIQKRESERTEREGNHSQGNGKKTLIDILLDSNNKAEEDVFTVQDVVDEFITFFAGGMDTTGHLLGMATYYLHQNPQYKARLMDEVNKYFVDPSKVDLDALNQMEFMSAFIKEALRMSTPAPIIIDRVAKEDHCLKDIKIRKGTLLNVCLLANNFNPAYHDDVNGFNPERWLEGSKTRELAAKSPYAYIPFSAGPHNCIGQHLAINEARAIFSMFLKRFDFALSPSYNHKMTMRLLYEPMEKLNFHLVPKEY